MNSLTILFNTEEHLISQFLNYDFNSFCHLDGKIYGASDQGIFEINNSDLDDTKDIWAMLELPKFDLGHDKNKIIRSLILDYRAEGQVVLNCFTDDKSEGPYILDPTGGTWMKTELPGDRGVTGENVQLRIENTDGCDFSLNSILTDIILRTV